MVSAEQAQSFEEVFKLHSAELSPALLRSLGAIKVSAELVEAAKGWGWKADPVFYKPELGTSVATGFFGRFSETPEEIFNSNLELMKIIGYPLDKVPNMTLSSGFSSLSQMTPGLEDSDYLLVEQLVAHELVTSALAAQGLKAEDVDFFSIATSIPLSYKIKDLWAKAVGIPEKTPRVGFCMACNSSGYMLERLFSGRFNAKIAKNNQNFLKGKQIIFAHIAIEDAHRNSNKGGGDPFSGQIFATAGSALVGRYSLNPDLRSMNMLVHKSSSVDDGTQFLLVDQPQLGWSESEKEDYFFAKNLKSPSGKGPIEMYPEAGVYFRNHALALAKEVIAKYERKGHLISNIKKVIVHHPSLTIFDNLKGKMVKLGFDPEQIQWVINEGNVPAATILIALGRQLKDLKPGDHVMFLSFGAGGEYTCFIAEMGDMGLQVRVA